MINKNNLMVAEFADLGSYRGTADVRFTPKETVATNGHYLVRISNPPSETVQTTTKEFSITAESLKAIKVKKGDAIELATNGTGSSWNLTTGASTYHLQETENSFPNYEAVMPREQPVTVIGFNPAYLAKVMKAFASFSDANAPQVKLSFYGPDKAAMFEATNTDGQKMTALLMPVRM